MVTQFMRRRWTLSLLFGAAVCLLLAAAPAFAQMGTGTILGQVTDPTGAVIPGATVTATNVDTSFTRSGTSNAQGSYRFPAMPVGNYRIEVSKPGFKSVQATGLVVSVGQEAEMNISLAVGATQETMEVTTAVPMVQTTNATIGNLVSPQQVSDLPLNGRNFTDLTLLVPGITQSRMNTSINNPGMQGLSYSSNGAPLRTNNVLLDGTSMRTMQGLNATSAGSTSLGLDGVQEYTVVTSMFGAEYGTAMGSQTNIVSKSGTNNWHGDAFEYFRNSSLDGRNYFDEMYSLPTDVPGGGKRIAEYQRNQFGGALGGPIQKNKTFLDIVYEGLREKTGNPINVGLTTTIGPATCFGSNGVLLATNNPCALNTSTHSPGYNPTGTVNATIYPMAELIPAPNVGTQEYAYNSLEVNNENYGQARVDHTFSNKDSAFVRYTIDNSGYLQPTFYPYWVDAWPSQNQFLTLSEDHIFSSSLLSTFRASFARTAESGGNIASPLVLAPKITPFFGDEAGIINASPMSTFGPIPHLNPVINQDIIGFSDDTFWTKGKHAMKFGASMNRYEDANTCQALKGGFIITTPQFYLTGYANSVSWDANGPGASAQPNAVVTTDWVYNYLGFYAQDDYRIFPRLTLNLGLRYEFSTVPNEKNGNGYEYQNDLTDVLGQTTNSGGLWNQNTLHDFSPRVGFAWNPFGNGKTSILGGFGMFWDQGDYGPMFYIQADSAPPPISQVWTQVATKITAPFAATPGPSTTTFPKAYTIDHNMKSPYLYQYNLQIQRELPGAMALSVSYVGTRGIHLYRMQDGNPVYPCNYPGGIPSNMATWCAGLTSQPWNNGMTPVWADLLTVGSTTSTFVYGAPCVIGSSCHLNQNQAELVLATSDGDSYYNSLQAGLTKRLSRGLQLQGAFTWGRSLDDQQGLIFSSADGSENTSNMWNHRFDYGPSGFNAKFNFRLSSLYTFPNLQGHGFIGGLLRGWMMGNMLAVQSGRPFEVTNNTGLTVSNSELNAMDTGYKVSIERDTYVTSQNLAWAQSINPNAVLYNPSTFITHNPNQWFNVNMMTVPQPVSGATGVLGATLGNESANKFTGPGMTDWDFSLVKGTSLPHTEAAKLQFRAELFNILNHTNFLFPQPYTPTTATNGGFGYSGTNSVANPSGAKLNSVAGLIEQSATNSRQIQFALRVIF